MTHKDDVYGKRVGGKEYKEEEIPGWWVNTEYLHYFYLHIAFSQLPFIDPVRLVEVADENKIAPEALPLNKFPCMEDFEVILWGQFSERERTPLLSSREPSMEEVHDAGELRQASAEARELEEQHPGPEQAPEDKGLEDEPQVVQDVLPALPCAPPAMLRETLDLWSLRGGFLLAGLQSEALETDQGVRTKDEFPPALDRGRVRHAVVCPP